MSDKLPVLFFYEDPEERRQRIDGALPPPAAVLLPRIGADGRAPDSEQAGIDYPLIEFACEPWHSATDSQSQAQAYAAWLNDIEAGRLATVVPLLAEAGAPVTGLRQDPSGLASFGYWLQQMFPVIAAPLTQQGFLSDDAMTRLGWAWRATSPQSHGWSRYADRLLGTMAHDLAFMVADCARGVRPGLAWQPYFDTWYRNFVVGIDPEPPLFDLTALLEDFLLQSVATPRGRRGHALRDWYALTLVRCYDRAVRGTAIPAVHDIFPDATAQRGYARLDYPRPNRSDPPAPPALVTAVDTLREAGWFDGVKYSSSALARGAQAIWQRLEGADIPLKGQGMYWRLLLFDAGRTWSDDVDAAVRPGDGLYEELLDEISLIRGKQLGSLWSVEEDWASRPGDLLLRFRIRRGQQRLLIPSAAPYLSGAVFAGLNDLAEPDEPRLWFLDGDGPLGIVTRATAAERAELESRTGLRLRLQPPSWWASLAPLPDREEALAVRPSRKTPARKAPARKAPAQQAPARKTATKPVTAQPVTAQAVFGRMMRTMVAPALRELGFTGTGARALTYRNGDYQAGFSTQKSRYSTKDQVDFWVHLTAGHLPTGSPYWTKQLHDLIPGNDRFSQWTVRADSPAEPVAEHLLTVFRDYGWPAVLAAVDSPGYPPDPAVRWPRSFAPDPAVAARGSAGPNLGPLTWPLRRTGRRDDLFADIADADEHIRAGAIDDIGTEAADDERAIPALLNRLENDRSPAVRLAAAAALRPPLAAQPEVRAALIAAAGQDEDHEVRWAARYALRLADADR